MDILFNWPWRKHPETLNSLSYPIIVVARGEHSIVLRDSYGVVRTLTDASPTGAALIASYATGDTLN